MGFNSGLKGLNGEREKEWHTAIDYSKVLSFFWI
jgi:hypothetical protein